jgi:hypothetical protein
VFALIVVLANVIVLCLQEHDDSIAKQALLRQANYVLTLLFLLELTLRYVIVHSVTLNSRPLSN